MHRPLSAAVPAIAALILTITVPQPVAPQSPRNGGPDIDRFLVNWRNVESRELYGLETRDLLLSAEGNPLAPKRPGAVLTDLLAVRRVVLAPKAKSPLAVTRDRQRIFYVAEGSGRVRTEKTVRDIRNGDGIMVPAGVSVGFEAAQSLVMYLIEEPSEPSDGRGILVLNEHDNPISTDLERTGEEDWLFNAGDGLTTLAGINPIVFEPRSGIPPHLHAPGSEEVWIAIWDGAVAQIGSQRREFPAGAAYKAPEDGRTSHTNINPSNKPVKLLWLMKVPRTPSRPRDLRRFSLLDRWSSPSPGL